MNRTCIGRQLACERSATGALAGAPAYRLLGDAPASSEMRRLPSPHFVTAAKKCVSA